MVFVGDVADDHFEIGGCADVDVGAFVADSNDYFALAEFREVFLV